MNLRYVPVVQSSPNRTCHTTSAQKWTPTAARNPDFLKKDAAARERTPFRSRTSARKTGGTCWKEGRPKRIMSAGRWLKPKRSAENTATAQKTWSCRSPFRIFVETIHVPREMRKRRKIISSPIPAVAEAMRDEGNGG